jgi:proline iminopeptidase
MTETFVTSDSIRLWTVAEGGGPAIVLCNGGPGCCDYLAPVAAMLTGVGTVIRFEPCGCGRSAPASSYSVETSLADLELIRQHYNIDQWIIMGHSWGADLALLYALHYPERVHGFVCIAGGRVHNDREWHRTYEQKREQERATMPVFDYPPNMDVNIQVNRSWKQYIQRPLLFKGLAGLDRPALFVYGEDDIRPSWPVQQVAALLPQAQFRCIAGADHHIWVTHAAELEALLQSFVRDVTRDSSITH